MLIEVKDNLKDPFINTLFSNNNIWYNYENTLVFDISNFIINFDGWKQSTQQDQQSVFSDPIESMSLDQMSLFKLCTDNNTNVDITPPSIPDNLKAEIVNSNQINLSWDPSTDNNLVDSYIVYRDGIMLASSNTNSFSDNNISISTSLSYQVSAIDNFGNESGFSNKVTIQLLGDVVTKPNAPNNLILNLQIE